ncbi:MAG: hypothetical protein U1F57_06475 [bacterium]
MDCNHIPSGCGNGTVGGTEQCDDGAANGTAASCCSVTCTFKSDGTVCNDGTPGVCNSTTDTCNHPPAGCGNGTVGGTEQCDDGAANGTAASCCTALCTLNRTVRSATTAPPASVTAPPTLVIILPRVAAAARSAARSSATTARPTERRPAVAPFSVPSVRRHGLQRQHSRRLQRYHRHL